MPEEQRRRSAAALPCLHDDGSVAGAGAAGCSPGTLEKPLDPKTGGKAALLAHHMYQQRDDADADLLQGDHERQHEQQRQEEDQRQQQPGRQQRQNRSVASDAGLGHGGLLQGGLAVAEAGLITVGPGPSAATGAAAQMQPLAVHRCIWQTPHSLPRSRCQHRNVQLQALTQHHAGRGSHCRQLWNNNLKLLCAPTHRSRIIDRALDDHLQHLGSVLEAARVPVADGPDSTLRGWEAADEGGAFSLGFQHLPADQVTRSALHRLGKQRLYCAQGHGTSHLLR